nr:MAG TPA: nucleoid-associated protein [Caudoviricetes sp.]
MRVEIPNQISVKIGGIISRGVKAVEVSDEGKLIFTLTDGSTVDLGSVIGPEGPKGETGPAGPTGPAGTKGDTGAAGASILSIEKTSQSGTTSTYTITMSDGQTFEFEVQSDKGEKGDKGDTGATGPKGPQGEQGPAGIVVQETEPTGPEHPVWVNPKGGASDPGITGKDGTTFTPSVSAAGDLSWTNDGGKENPETVNIKGPQGSPGITPNIQIGTVTTLQAGSDATASVSGTAENPLLNLGIPKGEAGGSDLSLGVTGAAVGQIARITAVDSDGKPTAWSPVDMAGGGGGETWELINEVTLSEDVMAVVFDKDKSGAAFALRKFAVFGWTKGSNASNTNGGTICINVANTADDIYSIVPPVYAHGALKGDQLRYWHAAAENFAEKGWRWYITGADNTRATNKANIGTSLTLLSQTIPKVATYLALWSRTSGSAFVAGSKIELYGVRA